jgi:hypothetical protein
VCLDHPPDEQAVLRYELGIDQLALEAGVALLDGRGPDHRAGHRREPEFLELVDPVTRAVADADHLLDQVDGGHIDDALLAPSEHLEAVIAVPDIRAEQRW